MSQVLTVIRETETGNNIIHTVDTLVYANALYVLLTVPTQTFHAKNVQYTII